LFWQGGFSLNIEGDVVIKKYSIVILLFLILVACSESNSKDSGTQQNLNENDIASYEKEIEDLKIENGKLKLENLKLQERVEELERRNYPGRFDERKEEQGR